MTFWCYLYGSTADDYLGKDLIRAGNKHTRTNIRNTRTQDPSCSINLNTWNECKATIDFRVYDIPILLNFQYIIRIILPPMAFYNHHVKNVDNRNDQAAYQ